MTKSINNVFRSFISLFLLGSTCERKAQAGFENTFVSKHMTEEGYAWIVKGIEEWSTQPDRCPGREALAARSFVRDLGSANRLSLEKYASEDINQNPIAVLWSQYFMFVDGRADNVSMPKSFRDLSFLCRTLYRHLKNEKDRALLSRQYLALVRRLKRENFLQPYYDQSWDGEYMELWLEDLPTHLLNLSITDADYVRQFLRELLLLENDLGAWYWDRDFARLIVTQYATNSFSDSWYQTVYISHAGGGFAMTKERREFEEMTRLCASGMLRLHNFKGARDLVPFYQELSREMVEIFYAKTRTIIEGFIAFAQDGKLHQDMIESTTEKMNRKVGGVLSWLSIPWNTIYSSRPDDSELSYMQISKRSRMDYDALGIPDEKPVSADDIARLREAVLSDKYCFNYFAITALINVTNLKDESNYWQQWRKIAERHIHIHDYYADALNLLGQDRMCDSYAEASDRFVELRKAFDVLQILLAEAVAAGEGQPLKNEAGAGSALEK